MPFEVITAVNIHVIILWNVTPCSVVDRYECFSGICCLYFSTVMLEAAFSYEMFVPIFQFTGRQNRGDGTFLF
jgi:hypothetical protein